MAGLSNCITPVLLGSYATPSSSSSSSSKGKSGSSKSSPLDIELGVVHGASGSARLTDSGASVLCAVHGPRASSAQGSKGSMEGLQFEVEVKLAQYVQAPTFSTHLQALGLPGGAAPGPGPGRGSGAQPSAASPLARSSVESTLSDLLRESLVGLLCQEQYPKTAIAVFATVLQSSGNLGQDLACAITCCSLALADAQVQMFDLVVASSASSFPSTCGASAVSDVSCVSPGVQGLQGLQGEATSGGGGSAHASSCMTVASRCNAAEMTQLWGEGRLQMRTLFLLLEAAAKANAAKKLQVQFALVDKVRQLGQP